MNAEHARLERKEIRAFLIGHKAERALRFQTIAVRRLGPQAGIFARQLLFWDGRGVDPDGWTYKSINEFQDETGLSRRQQGRARKVLGGKGLMDELKKVGPDGRWRLFYRLNLPAIMDLLGDDLIPFAGSTTLNPSSRVSGISEQGPCPVLPSSDYARYERPDYTEEYPLENPEEITSSNTETSSVAATDISGKGSGETSEDSVTGGKQQRSAREFVAGVYAQTTPSGRSTLDEVVKETPKRTYTNADTFGSQYKQLIAAKDLTPEEYEAVVAIVADDLCSPQQALKVIRDEGKPSTDDVSSSPAPEEHFEGSTPRPLTTGDHKAIQRVLDDPESDSGKAGRAFNGKSGGVESMVEVIEAVNREAFDGKRTVPEIGRAVEDALEILKIMEVFA